MTFEINRSNVLTLLLKTRGYQPAGEGERPNFSYATRPTGVVHNIPVTTTSTYCTKRRFYQLLKKYDKIHDLPPTYLSLAEVPHPLPSGLWFVKKDRGSRGEAVYCINDWPTLELKISDLKDGSYVIQKGIDRLDLLDGRKYTLRVYLLHMGDGRIFVYNRVVGIKHKFPYTATCADHEVHVDHKGATRFDFRQTHPQADLIFQRIITTCAETYACFQREIDMGEAKYHIYGLDFLVDENFKPWFIEMNGFPNVDSVADDVREDILVDFFSDLYDLVIAPALHGLPEKQGQFTLCL